MNEVRPDKRLEAVGLRPRLFLAGSIEQGKAEDWQALTVKALTNYTVDIYNPRVAKWDDKLEQTIMCDAFREQVIWEQRYLAKCEYVLFNFIGDTKSPISLLELGQCCNSTGQQVIVVCPPEFWRRGNIELVTTLFKMPLYRTLDEGIAHVKTRLTYAP